MTKVEQGTSSDSPEAERAREARFSKRWKAIAMAFAALVVVGGMAITGGLFLNSQAHEITELKDENAQMEDQVAASQQNRHEAEKALKAITKQLAKTKKSLAVEKRKASEQYFSGYSSGYSESLTSYNDGYDAGYDAGWTDGYNRGLCIDPSSGNWVC